MRFREGARNAPNVASYPGVIIEMARVLLTVTVKLCVSGVMYSELRHCEDDSGNAKVLSALRSHEFFFLLRKINCWKFT